MPAPFSLASRGPNPGRLNVALVTETWPPEVNGVAHTLERLTEGLRERGHRVQVIRPRQGLDRPVAGPRHATSPEDVTLPGIAIPGYRGLRMGLPSTRRLRRLWRHSPPDVAYIATEGPLGHAALAVARQLGIPVASGFHTRFDGYARHYGLGLLTLPVRRLLRRFHNRCGATLAPTRALAEELRDQGFQRVGVLARGVDTRRFTPARRSRTLRGQWGASGPVPVVIHVGRLAAEKNLDLVIAAFRAIQTIRSDARLVLVGDGPQRERLARTHPDVILAGQQTGQALAQHYASGDLFLFPSTSETFGNVVIEAMASGLPVLAFDTAAAHEHLADGVSGVRVSLTGSRRVDEQAFVRAARELAGHPEQWPLLGARAREHASTLDWSEVIGGFESVLVQLVQTEARDAHASAHG